VAPRFPSTLRSRTASRPLVDAVLREHVERLPNVRIMDGTEVTGLVGDASGIRGVRVRRRGGGSVTDDAGEADGPGDVIKAWLVVDASGRGSRVGAHLASMGLAPPEETVVDASLRYATRLVRKPDHETGWTAMIVHDRPPGTTRGGAILEIEGDRWIVTLGGAGTAGAAHGAP
jgi:2-polyprenyl-6-methoxyphenol hydroxylase-like FAD-dependent oxidoreductase